jgi:hypothetical protein
LEPSGAVLGDKEAAMSVDIPRGGNRLMAREETVVSQASAVVAGAVYTTVTGALRASSRCGCLRCRQRAATTVAWAVDFLKDEPVPAVASAPPRRLWR